MKSRTAQIIGVVTLLWTASCAPAPSVRHVGEDGVPGARDPYLASNPGGTYNQFISRGEIVPGMQVTEVMASWGKPSLRSLETKRGEEFEQWTYRMTQMETGTQYRYRLFFQDYRLRFWEVDRESQSMSFTSGVEAAETPSHPRSSFDISDKE